MFSRNIGDITWFVWKWWELATLSISKHTSIVVNLLRITYLLLQGFPCMGRAESLGLKENKTSEETDGNSQWKSREKVCVSLHASVSIERHQWTLKRKCCLTLQVERVPGNVEGQKCLCNFTAKDTTIIIWCNNNFKGHFIAQYEIHLSDRKPPPGHHLKYSYGSLGRKNCW